MAVVDPHKNGQIAGHLLAVLLFLFGSLHCFRISRRPGTNAKCCLSLMCILLVFAIPILLSAGAVLAPGPVWFVLITLGSLALIPLMVMSVVLAILGLLEYSRAGSNYVQGRAQAVWALVLCGVIGLAFVAGLVHSVARIATTKGRPAPAMTNSQFNFVFRSPPTGWSSWDISRLNQDAQFGLLHSYPEVGFMLIAEVCAGQNWNSETLTEYSESRMRSVCTVTRVLPQAPKEVNGLQGILSRCETTSGSQELFYARWCCITNGWAFQLVGWGRKADQPTIDSAFQNLLPCFSLMDPARVARAGNSFAGDFKSPRFNYTAAVRNTLWTQYEDKGKQFPEAEFAACLNGGCVAVVPVWLGTNDLELEPLASGLLSVMNIPCPDPNLTDRSEVTMGPLHGIQYDYERAIGKEEWRYRLRCLRANQMACLVAAWTGTSNLQAEAFFTNAFSLMTFSPPAFDLTMQDPGKKHPDRPSDLTAQDLKTRGHVLNTAGIVHFKQRDYEKALPLFQDAARACPEEAVYTLNAAQTWSHLDRPEEALKFLEGRPEDILHKPDIRAYHAWFQAEAGRVEESLTNAAGLFASGYRNDDHFTTYVERLTDMQKYDAALDEIARYLKTRDSVAVRLSEARVYQMRQEYPRATSLLQTLRNKAPYNQEVASALVEVCLRAGRYNEALDTSREIVKMSPESAYACFLKGRSEFGLKWYREARTSLEQALKLAPTSPEIRNFLDLVSNTLGEGNTLLLKKSIPPVPLPASLAGTTVPGASNGFAREFGAFYQRHITAINYQNGRQCRTTDYLFVHILDPAGIAAFSTIQSSFDPAGEEICVNSLRVLDADGNLLSTGTNSDYYVLDDHSSQIVSQKKTLNIPIPGLRPGCTIELVTTRNELGRIERFPFLEHYFSHAFPCLENVLWITGDTGNLKCMPPDGASKVQVPENGLCWRFRTPPVACIEPIQPDATRFLPRLLAADGSEQWRTVATNYLDSIREQLKPDTNLAVMVRQIVRGLPDDDARVRALARHVQTSYTYKAILFGRRARIPNSIPDIIRNKYGDCKDHSLLLQQMMNAAGIPASLAVVRASGGPVCENLPSLDQFDHMIVYLPRFHDGLFLDATDKGASLVVNPPGGLAQARALVLDPENPRFVDISPYRTNAASFSVHRRIQFTSPTEGSVEETLTLDGVYAAHLRALLQQLSSTTIQKVLQQSFASESKHPATFRITGLEEPGRLDIALNYPIRRPFHHQGGAYIGNLPAGMERTYLAAETVEPRRTPFELRLPIGFQICVEVVPPHDCTAQMAPAAPLNLDARFAGCQTVLSTNNGTLRLSISGHRLAGIHDAQDYSSYRDTMMQILSQADRDLILKP